MRIFFFIFFLFVTLSCTPMYRIGNPESGYIMSAFRGRISDSDFIHSLSATGIADYTLAPIELTTFKCTYIDFTGDQDTILHKFFITLNRWSTDTGGDFRGKYMFVIKRKNKEYMAKGDFFGNSTKNHSVYFELPVTLDTNADSARAFPPIVTTFVFSGASYKYNYVKLPNKNGEISIVNDIPQNSFMIGTLEDKNKLLIPIGAMVISGIRWRAPVWLRWPKDSTTGK